MIRNLNLWVMLAFQISQLGPEHAGIMLRGKLSEMLTECPLLIGAAGLVIGGQRSIGNGKPESRKRRVAARDSASNRLS